MDAQAIRQRRAEVLARSGESGDGWVQFYREVLEMIAKNGGLSGSLAKAAIGVAPQQGDALSAESISGADLVALRRSLRLTQAQFWSAVNATQSAGSRYESGRQMPKPLAELVRLVYVEGVNLAAVEGDDVRLAMFLRTHEPALFEVLRKGAAAAASGVASDE